MSRRRCCCEESSCLLFEDQFNRSSLGTDWEVLTGSWSLEDNRLKNSSSGKILCNYILPEDKSIYISVKFPVSEDTADNVVALLLDCDGSGTAQYSVEVLVKHQTEGTVTIKNGSGDILRTADTVINSDDDIMTLFVCIHSYAIIAYVTNQTLRSGDVLTPIVRGSTGSVAIESTVSSYALFDDFSIYLNGLEQSDCPNCTYNAPCGLCSDYPDPPYILKVVLTGIVNNPAAGPPPFYSECSDCDTTFNGTHFVLPPDYIVVNCEKYSLNKPTGPGACTAPWNVQTFSNTILAFLDCNNLGVSQTMIKVIASRAVGSYYCRIEFWSELAEDCSQVDCQFNELDVPWFRNVNSVMPRFCIGSASSTCKITKVS